MRRHGPPDDERALLERRAREVMPIARTVARRMFHKLGGLLSVDDLLDIAQPALLDALRSYDPERAPLTAYVVMKLKWAMLAEARKLTRQRRAAARATACLALCRLEEADELAADERKTEGPTTEVEDQARLSTFLAQRTAAMALGLMSSASAPRADNDSPEDRLAQEELRNALQSAVEVLPERHRALVERHYFGGESFDAIATDLGISKSWASRLHAQAMTSLAGALKGVV